MFSAASLKYLGGIRTPHETTTDVNYQPNSYPSWGALNDGTGFGGRPFALDLERHEFVLGTRYSRVARLQMIDPVMHTEDVNALPVAPYVTMTMVGVSGPSTLNDPPQTDMSWFEIMASLDPTNTSQGGFIPYGTDKLITSGQNYYDANGNQIRTAFIAKWPAASPATAYDSERTPFYTFGDIQQGLVAGYFTPIPPKWRTLLKGDMLQGNASLPIITRGSAGPCASSFHVADVLAASVKAHPLAAYPPTHWVSRYAKDLIELWKRQPRLAEEPIPITFLVGYPSGHWMPGHPWDNINADDIYGMATQITGMSIIGDTIVFVGSHGYGTPCYGNGTSDPNLAGTVGPDGEIYCYDPTSSAKANHAYPYRLQVWHYPLAQLAEVAAGNADPWSMVPEWFELELPFVREDSIINGCAYDPTTKRFYLNVYGADGYGYEPGPVIYVYEYTGDDPDPPDPPPIDHTCTDPDCLAQIEELESRVLSLESQLAAAAADLVESANRFTAITTEAEGITQHTARILELSGAGDTTHE